MTTGIKITFSVQPQDAAAVLSALTSAPSGVKTNGVHEFAKHTRFIIQFRDIPQLTKFFNDLRKNCTGKYAFMKNPRGGKVFASKVYLQKRIPGYDKPHTGIKVKIKPEKS